MSSDYPEYDRSGYYPYPPAVLDRKAMAGGTEEDNLSPVSGYPDIGRMYNLEMVVITLTPTPTFTPTPTSTPTRTPTPIPRIRHIPRSDLEGYFSKYASEYGVSVDLLKKIAYCESGFNTGSVNGPYGGMFQFTASSWAGVRSQMGADANPDLRFNGEEAIRTAAFKISRGGAGIWPNCSK